MTSRAPKAREKAHNWTIIYTGAKLKCELKQVRDDFAKLMEFTVQLRPNGRDHNSRSKSAETEIGVRGHADGQDEQPE